MSAPGEARDYPELMGRIETELSSHDDLSGWIARNRGTAGIMGLTFFVSPRYRGLPLAVAYGDGGRVLAARARGPGGVEQDVTRALEGEVHYPGFFPGRRFVVRYVMALDGGAHGSPRGAALACLSGGGGDGGWRRRAAFVPLDYELEDAPFEWAEQLERRQHRLGFIRDILLPAFKGNGGRGAAFEFEEVWLGELTLKLAWARDLAGDPDRPVDSDGAVVEFADPGIVAALGGRLRPAWAAKFGPPAAGGARRGAAP